MEMPKKRMPGNRGGARRHTRVAVKNIRTMFAEDLAETLKRRPKHRGIAIEEIDLEMSHTGGPQSLSILRPVRKTLRPAGRNNSNVVRARLRFTQPCDDTSRAAPEKWNYVEDAHTRTFAEPSVFE